MVLTAGGFTFCSHFPEDKKKCNVRVSVTEGRVGDSGYEEDYDERGSEEETRVEQESEERKGRRREERETRRTSRLTVPVIVLGVMM